MKYLPHILLSIYVLLFFSCQEEYNLARLPAVNMLPVEKSSNSASQWKLAAQVEILDNQKISDFDISSQGFEISDLTRKNTSELIGNLQSTDNPKVQTFIANIDDVILDSDFAIRAFIEINNNKIYSNLLFDNSSGIRLTSSLIERNLRIELTSSVSGLFEQEEIEAYGHCWMQSESALESFPAFTVEEASGKTINIDSFNEQFQEVLDLEPGFYYYLQPYVKIKGRFSYGNQLSTFLGDFWTRLIESTACQTTNLFPVGCLTEAVSFSINGKGYIGTGFRKSSVQGSDSDFGITKFWEYDTTTKLWTPLEDTLPGLPRTDATAFVINDKAYIGIGRYPGQTVYLDFYSFTPESDTWLKMDDFPIYLRSAVSFVINDKAYVGTGFTCIDGNRNCKFTNRFFEFDPTRASGKQWREVEPCPVFVREASGFQIGEKGYLVGGISNRGHSSEVFEFDPSRGTLDSNGLPKGKWEKLALFPGRARQKAIGFALNGKGYVGSGTDINTRGDRPNFDDFFEFTPPSQLYPSGLWITVRRLPSGYRDSAAGFVINDTEKGDRAYLYGGNRLTTSNNLANDFWIYTPDD